MGEVGGGEVALWKPLEWDNDTEEREGEEREGEERGFTGLIDGGLNEGSLADLNTTSGGGGGEKTGAGEGEGRESLVSTGVEFRSSEDLELGERGVREGGVEEEREREGESEGESEPPSARAV